jgi:superfamily II DNA or RNA helicase
MLARILDNHTIQFEQITTPEELLLKKHFSVKHPRARYIDSTSGCNFDGVYYKYREKTRTLSRAFLGDLRKFCAAEKLPLTVFDDRGPAAFPAPDPALVTPDYLPGLVLEDYQIRSIRATCTAEVGLIEAPTGAGKGEIIAAITKLHNCPTVIIAEQTVVIEELKTRLEIREVASDIGVFMAGKRPNGQLVIIGMIQSLSAPTVPPKKTLKDTPLSYARKLQAFHTRLKNARVLRAMITKCELLLIDEADRAVNKQYRQLIRHYYKGRRRYGLCLSGDTCINTIGGLYRLNELPLGPITLLADNGTCSGFSNGTLIQCGIKRAFQLTAGEYRITASADHLIAKDDGRYIRIDDIIPGQLIKIHDDTLVDDLKYLIASLGEFDSSSYLSNISRHGFQFSRANFNEHIIDLEVYDILPESFEFIANYRVLCDELFINSVEKLHKDEFIRGTIISEITASGEIISSFKFGRKLESPASIALRQSITDLLSDFRTIDRISSEHLDQCFSAIINRLTCLKDDRDSISLHHGLLNSIDDIPNFHRVVNAILSKAGLLPLIRIIERFDSVVPLLNDFQLILITRNSKPIGYAIFNQHFLAVSFSRSLSSLDDLRQSLDTLSTQMPSKVLLLITWFIRRSCKLGSTIIALHKHNVMISDTLVIPFSLDYHGLSVSKKVPFYFCRKVIPVESIVDTRRDEIMYDIVEVEKYHNFYANNMLVHNSGTFFDPAKPVENMNLRENLGSIIATTNRDEVQSRGRIIPVVYTTIAFGNPKKRHDKTAFDLAEKEWIEDNVKFQMLIKALAERNKADPEHGTVILCENINLGKKLAEAIDPDLNPVFIYGQTGKQARRAAITAFQKRECRVLIGSKIIRRGMDLKGGCETLIIATAGKLWSEFNQMIGRSVRLNKKKMCQVYDIFHLNNHYLYLHSRMRLKHIVGMGYVAKVVFPGIVISATDFIKSRFKMPTVKKA